MTNRRLFIALTAPVVAMLPGLFSATQAQSIDDAGFRAGFVRTDYADGLGTDAHPLQLRYDQAGVEGCRFNATDAFTACPGRRGLPALPGSGYQVWQGAVQTRIACGGDNTALGDTWRGCSAWPDNLYFGTPGVASQFWVLHANDEPSFDQCNEGPPALSHPVRDLDTPTPGLFRVGVVRPPNADPYASITLDVGAKNYHCTAVGGLRASLPFLSIGAQQGRGNGGPVAAMNREGSPRGTIAFTLSMPAYQPYACATGTGAICTPAVSGVHMGVYGLAEWAGTKHLLFVDLFGAGVEDFSANPPGGNAHWNWPIADSFFFPGADASEFVAGAPLQQQCGIAIESLPADGTGKTYRIDFGRLYRCASDLHLYADPMPAGDVMLTGVHWFIEGAGTTGSLTLNLSRPETALFVAGFD